MLVQHKIPFHTANPLRSARSQPRPQPLAKYGHGRRRHRVPLSLLSLPYSLPLCLPSYLEGALPRDPGAITAQKSGERPGRRRERRGGDCEERREKEEITLYCILVNWRGSKRPREGEDGEEIGAAAPSSIPEKRTPARPAHFIPSFTPRKVEIT